ncbi:unnamed protein product, partial [Effrenium voratum]
DLQDCKLNGRLETCLEQDEAHADEDILDVAFERAKAVAAPKSWEVAKKLLEDNVDTPGVQSAKQERKKKKKGCKRNKNKKSKKRAILKKVEDESKKVNKQKKKRVSTKPADSDKPAKKRSSEEANSPWIWQGHDLQALGFPEEAWPTTEKTSGTKSFTLVCSQTSAAIEAIFSRRAFLVKRFATGVAPVKGSPKQFSWVKYEGAGAAWVAAAKAAGFQAQHASSP